MMNEVDDFMDRHGDELAAYLGPVLGRYDISKMMESAMEKVVEKVMEEIAARLAHQVTGVAMTVYDTIASTNG